MGQILNRRRVMGGGGGFPSNAIMTIETNPEVLAACYAKGWCASPEYMTLEEAQAVPQSQLSGFLMSNTSVTHFEEFKYFTGITFLPTNTFRAASNLATLELPPSVTDFGDYVAPNSGLVEFDTKNLRGLQNNNSGSFSNLTKLKTLHIGAGLQKMKDRVCQNHPLLETITVDSNNTYFSTDGKCLIETSTNSVCIATKNCNSVPEGVTAIRNGCFAYGYVLTTLTLPSTLTSIGAYMFYNTRITNLVCLATTPPTCETNAFNNITVTNIYVPDASVDAYKAATGWSSYASKIKGISQM